MDGVRQGAITSGFTVSFHVSVFQLRITARKKPPFLRVDVRFPGTLVPSLMID